MGDLVERLRAKSAEAVMLAEIDPRDLEEAADEITRLLDWQENARDMIAGLRTERDSLRKSLAAERERCAGIADYYAEHSITAKSIALAIRTNPAKELPPPPEALP